MRRHDDFPHSLLHRVFPAFGLARGQEADAVGQNGRARLQRHVARLNERRVALETRDDPAIGVMELGPPGVVVIAQIEHIGRASDDRHLFGGGDVVDVGGRDGVIDRAAQIGVIDDMGLGAADIGRKARPLRANAGQRQAGRVDEMHDLAHFAAQSGRRHAEHPFEQAGEYLRAAAAIGVGEGGAAHALGADVIEPALVARHRRFDVAQRGGAGELRKQQRDQLIAGRELAHQFVAPVLFHKLVEGRPRDKFENAMEDAILMAHGVDPFLCPDESPNPLNPVESMSCASYSKK